MPARLKKEKGVQGLRGRHQGRPAYQQAHYYLGVSLIEQKNKRPVASLEEAVTLGKDTQIGKAAQDKLDKLDSSKLRCYADP